MRPGVRMLRSLISVVSVLFKSAAENAETAIGVFCTAAALVFWAVTTISSKPFESLFASSAAAACRGTHSHIMVLRLAQMRQTPAECVRTRHFFVHGCWCGR